MKKEIIYSLESPYRDEFKIKGFKFGEGTKAVCIVGSTRGNEVQQLYICSQLVKELIKLEKKGEIIKENEILVIPCVNNYGMNIGKRFWTLDNTDINRMFPGYDRGETTQRIAAGLFKNIQDYNYGIQFTSFYMQGTFIPHVRMMETGFKDPNVANLFGLKYLVLRKPKPFDTTTLNYNWQLWNTNAFSVYTNSTDKIDEESAKYAVESVLRFLAGLGIIKYNNHSGYITNLIDEDNLIAVTTNMSGIYRRLKNPGDIVEKGDVLAEIIDPYEGGILGQITASSEGIIFFAYTDPLVNEYTVVYKILSKTLSK